MVTELENADSKTCVVSEDHAALARWSGEPLPRAKESAHTNSTAHCALLAGPGLWLAHLS